MGTPEFAVPHLQLLAESGHDVVGVVTRPNRPAGRGRRLQAPPVKLAAEELGFAVHQPDKLNEPSFRDLVEALAPDCVCVVAYGAFLPRWLLEQPPAGCVNVHPSLLPKYRGAAPIQRAIMNGELETGVSTMYMSEEMDAGDVILQERVPINASDDAGTLHDRLAQIGARLLVRTVDLIAQGAAPRHPQEESEVTFAPKIGPEDEKNRLDAVCRRHRCASSSIAPPAGSVHLLSRPQAETVAYAPRCGNTGRGCAGRSGCRRSRRVQGGDRRRNARGT